MTRAPGTYPDIIHVVNALRKTLGGVDEARVTDMFQALARGHPDIADTEFALHPGRLCITQNGGEIAFPRPLPLVKYVHIACGYAACLAEKYTMEGFVAVDPGDTVIDCGAYVGGFSMAVASVAGAVHAFEPEAANFACLLDNLRDHPHVTCAPMGLYDQTRSLMLNISASGVEHSFLTPDDGDALEVRETPVTRLDEYCRTQDIAGIDFLKLEAEGVEPEILTGLGDLRPRKLAVDVSPERMGQSPLDTIRPVLERLGYDIRVRGHVLFARR